MLRVSVAVCSLWRWVHRLRTPSVRIESKAARCGAEYIAASRDRAPSDDTIARRGFGRRRSCGRGDSADVPLPISQLQRRQSTKCGRFADDPRGIHQRPQPRRD